MPMTKPLVAALLLGWAALALAADPDEIALLERLKSMYPATQWTSVTRTPMPGVYEARMGSNLAYVGERRAALSVRTPVRHAHPD